MIADVVTQFACGIILIFGFVVFYVLWDNSCKKFNEVSEKIGLCMEPLSGRMLATDSLLEKYAKTDEDKETIKQIIKFRKVYECRLNTLQDCLKRP